MKRFLLVTALLMPTVAFAQEPTKKLEVTDAEINIIGKGLAALPYGEVAPLINKLQIQIAQQNKPVEVPKKEGE